MMKQPAENVNATPEEEERARSRASPIFLDSPEVQAEIARLASEFLQKRGGFGEVPEPEDWARAETVVRNRIQSTGTA